MAQKILKQPSWLRKITISHDGLENKQPHWLRKFEVKKKHIIPEFLISFEAWAKLAQKWLVSVPLGIHLEPINEDVMLLVTV